MIEMLTIAIKCPNCGTSVETLPDIERVVCVHCGTTMDVPASHTVRLVLADERRQDDKERVEALLAVKKLMAEVPQLATLEDETPDRSLDELIPPPLIEKSLPLLALLAVIAGFFALAISLPLAYGLMILDPILVSAYLFARTERRTRARELSHTTFHTWSLDFNTLQRSL